VGNTACRDNRELRQRGEYVEDEPYARSGDVQRLFERPEADPAPAQTGHDDDEVLQGTAEPVQGPGDQGVALAQVVQGLSEFSRSTFVPDFLSAKIRMQPASISAVICQSRNWSFAETAIPWAGDTR
jgi:hypothetical protein